jgi:hypothetical protein
LDDSYISVRFSDSTLHLYNLQNYKKTQTFQDIISEVADDFLSNGKMQLCLVTKSETIILVDEKTKGSEAKNPHLYSIGRALSSRNEAGHQLIHFTEQTVL